MNEIETEFKIKTLRRLETECRGCHKCHIGEINDYSDPHVFSNMNFRAKVIVCGQNPGADEVKQKRPFVGISGRNFDNALAEVGLSRKQFYISNAIRCFSPMNRPPLPEELSNCRYYLINEIDVIKPAFIVTLGEFGLRTICKQKGVMELHGNILYSNEFKVKVFPLIHPSPLNLNKPGKMEIFKKDIKKLKELMEEYHLNLI